MSYFDDYIADGLCCECCGAYMGDEPGFVQRCDGCRDPKQVKVKKPRKKAKAK